MIALFDLDYTMTRRGTWGRFVWRTVRARPWLWIPLLAGTLANQIDYKRGRTPRGTVKRTMMRWSLMRRKRAELQAMAEDFARREVRRLRDGALPVLREHKGAGHTVMVASAAVDLLVEPICRELGIAHYVCTRTQWDGERLCDTFRGENCYGDAKRRAVEAYWSEHGLSGPAGVFYTDSRADFALAPVCDTIVVVNPKSKTRAEAEAAGYAIVDWNG